MLKFEILTESDADAERVIEKTMMAMEAAIAMNQLWLADHPGDICFLTCGTIRYDFEQATTLSDVIAIKTIPILKKTRIGLCISFVAFDIAVRRMMGQEAVPHVRPTENHGVFHVSTAVHDEDGVEVIDPTEEIINHGSYLSAPALCKC